MLGVVLHTLEAHEGMGAHEMTWDSRGRVYVDAVGLARGRNHAIPPWPDQKAHEAKYCFANEALAVYIRVKVWYLCSSKFQ